MILSKSHKYSLVLMYGFFDAQSNWEEGHKVLFSFYAFLMQFSHLYFLAKSLPQNSQTNALTLE